MDDCESEPVLIASSYLSEGFDGSDLWLRDLILQVERIEHWQRVSMLKEHLDMRISFTFRLMATK